MTREEAITILSNYDLGFYDINGYPIPQLKLAEACGMAIEALSADAVQVVRCKDCKYKVTTEDAEYNPEDIVCDYWDTDGLEETDFCSYGERR